MPSTIYRTFPLHPFLSFLLKLLSAILHQMRLSLLCYCLHHKRSLQSSTTITMACHHHTNIHTSNIYNIHTCIQTCMRVHTYVFSYIVTYTHTHTYTYIHKIYADHNSSITLPHDQDFVLFSVFSFHLIHQPLQLIATIFHHKPAISWVRMKRLCLLIRGLHLLYVPPLSPPPT